MRRRLSQHVAWYRGATNAAYDTPAPFNGTTNYVRNGLNQYYAGGAFSYDGRGNLTSTQGTAYGYDSFNRLTNAGAATFAYDAAGRLRESVGAGCGRWPTRVFWASTRTGIRLESVW